MNTIDFTKPDGFPLDEDVMDFLQQAKLRADAALFADCPANTLVVLSGLQVTNTTGLVYLLSPGFFYLNGQVHHTQGNYQNIAGAGLNELGMTVATATEGLLFEDGSVKNVLFKDAHFFDLKPDGTANFYPQRQWRYWLEFAGPRAKTLEQGISVTEGPNGGLSGTIYYRKNLFANTLHIRGTVTATDAQALYVPTNYQPLCILPEGYRPASDHAPFAMLYRYHTLNWKKNSDGVIYLTQINARLRMDGYLEAGFIRPEAGVTSYGVSFNTIIPLD